MSPYPSLLTERNRRNLEALPSLPPSFPPDEDVFQQLLGDEAVGPGRALRGPSVQSAVDGVQFRAQLASDVEPPIAHEHCLAELRAVRAQERCLASVYVAIMPRLASRLHVREEAWIGLVVAVEIRVRHLAQHGIIGASSTCKQKKRIFDKLVRFFFEFLEIFVQILIRFFFEFLEIFIFKSIG